MILYSILQYAVIVIALNSPSQHLSHCKYKLLYNFDFSHPWKFTSFHSNSLFLCKLFLNKNIPWSLSSSEVLQDLITFLRVLTQYCNLFISVLQQWKVQNHFILSFWIFHYYEHWVLIHPTAISLKMALYMICIYYTGPSLIKGNILKNHAR